METIKMPEEVKQDSKLNVKGMETKVYTATKELSIDSNDERTFTCTMSAEVKDLDNEVVLIDGIDLSRFQIMSPVLWNHNVNVPVGHVTDILRGQGYIKAKVKIMTRPADYVGEFPADLAWECVRQGSAGGVSVGFAPKEVRRPTPRDKERFGNDLVKVISKSLLIELSVTPLPANTLATL